MAQMWILLWPKTTTTTTKNTNVINTFVKTSGTIPSSSSIVEDNGTKTCYCGCLTRLLKKLKKQGKMLCAATASRQSSFQCRYDPLSYSLNFDTSEYGSLLDDEDYYQFCAFSSRFVANPKAASPSLVATAH